MSKIEDISFTRIQWDIDIEDTYLPFKVVRLSDAQAEIDKQQDSCVETVILHKKKIKSLEQENKELIKRLQESQDQEMILGMAYDKYKKENKELREENLLLKSQLSQKNDWDSLHRPMDI